MFKKNILVQVLILIIALGEGHFAQKKIQPEILNPDRTINCESVSAIYDSFAQETSIEKNIIIVSYKGENESRKEISERRLYNAKIYFTEYYKNTPFFRPENKIITAFGVKETKEGRLDFYVDGELRLTLIFKDDKDLNLSPCHVEGGDFCKDKTKKLFYPCKKN